MNLLTPIPPTVSPRVSSAVPEQKPQHFFYMLHFQQHPDAYKVGISDPVDLRIRQLSSTYGPLDLPRCVTVAVNRRREAEALERTVLMLHEESRHDWGCLHPDAGGRTEWLRMASHAEVLATLMEWVRRRAAHCRLVPIAEVAGNPVNREGRVPVANRISEAERRQGVLARRRVKEATRRQANHARLRFTHKVIEEHLSYLRRVQIFVDWRRQLQARLLFRAGEPGGAPGRGFDPVRLASRLAAQREITIHGRPSRRPADWALTRSHKLIVPRSGGRYGLLVCVSVPMCALDADFVQQTPELDDWVRWLHLLRAWAREQRFKQGGTDQLTLPF